MKIQYQLIVKEPNHGTQMKWEISALLDLSKWDCLANFVNASNANIALDIWVQGQ